MAATRAVFCGRWTLQFCSPFELPIRNYHVYKYLCGVIYSSRRCLSNEAVGEMSETKPPQSRNLFEVYQSNSSLLTKSRDKRKPYTEEDANREIRRQQRLLRKAPAQIKPGKYPWTSGSKRVGAIGVKLGMSALWLKDGRRMAVTLIQVREIVRNFVTTMLFSDANYCFLAPILSLTTPPSESDLVGTRSLDGWE